MTLWKLETVLGLDAVEAGVTEEMKPLEKPSYAERKRRCLDLTLLQTTPHPVLQSPTIDLTCLPLTQS